MDIFDSILEVLANFFAKFGLTSDYFTAIWEKISSFFG